MASTASARARAGRVNSLHRGIFRPIVAHPLRRCWVATVDEVCLPESNKNAVLAFTGAAVHWLDEALIQASGERRLEPG